MIARLLIFAMTLVLLGGCFSTGSTISNKLDPTTAVTITFSDAPLIFYRDESGRAAYARDYVYLGPIEVNKAGTFRYYIWLGIWTTMQTPEESVRDGFETIVLIADGEPLPLEVAGWTAAAVGASEPVYLKPVASAADAYYEVTVDQLRFIAASRDIRVQSTGAKGAVYEPWNEQKSAKANLAEFLRTTDY